MQSPGLCSHFDFQTHCLILSASTHHPLIRAHIHCITHPYFLCFTGDQGVYKPLRLASLEIVCLCRSRPIEAKLNGRCAQGGNDITPGQTSVRRAEHR
jgi:hypothetical protein